MGKKILLADDSITIQKVIELTFSDEDFEVVAVGNGRLAIEKVQEERPDIVLCDIVMPEQDGYEVCEYIKTQPSLAHIPVLLLTGAFEPFDETRAQRVGCDGFLAKPFEPQNLISKVRELLSAAPVRRPASGPPPVAAQAPPPAAPVLFPPPVLESFELAEPEAAAPDRSGTVSFQPAGSMPFAPEPQAEVAFEVTPAPPPSSPTAPEGFVGGEAEAPGGFGVMEPSPSPFEEFAVPEAVSAASFVPAGPQARLEGPATLPASALGEVREKLAEEFGDQTVAFSAADTPLTGSPGSAGWPAASPAGVEESPTIELPLEERAAEGLSASARPEVSFEESFDEPLPAESLSAPASAAPTRRTAETRLPDFSAGPPAPGSDTASFETVLTPRSPVSFEPLPPVPPELLAPSAPEPAPLLNFEPTPEPAGVSFDAAPAGVSFEAPVEPEAVPRADVAAAPQAARGATDEFSFDGVVPAERPARPGPASQAAAVAVPVEMVQQIARRVVGEFSEKLVREIAWEVIPELAEALIKKEIDRLKAELRQLQ